MKRPERFYSWLVSFFYLLLPAFAGVKCSTCQGFRIGMRLRVLLMIAIVAVVLVGAVAFVVGVPTVSLRTEYPFCNPPKQMSFTIYGGHCTLSDDTANYSNTGSESLSAAWFGYGTWNINGNSYFGKDPRPILPSAWEGLW
jgi:hypothetical protein